MKNTYDWNRVELDSDDNNIIGTFSNSNSYGLIGIDDYSSNRNNTRTIDTLQGMEDYARASGLDTGSFDVDKKEEGIFHKAMKYINAPIAVIAGTANWALNDNIKLSNSIGSYYENTEGFGKLIKKELRDAGVSTNSRTAQAGIFTAGLLGDIFLDPTTYLTLGLSGIGKAALKSGQVLAKIPTTERVFDAFTKTWKTAEVIKEVPFTTRAYEVMSNAKNEYSALSFSDELMKEGMTREAAEKTAKDLADNDVEKLFNDVAVSGDVSKDMFDTLLTKGLSRSTIEDMSAIAPKMIEKNGVNWFGLRLIDSETLKNTKFGVLVNDLVKSDGVQGLIESIKTPFMTKFVYGFGKNKELLDMLNQLDSFKRIETDKILTEMSQAISNLSPKEQSELFEAGFAQKLNIVDESKKMIEESLTKLKKEDPELVTRILNIDDNGARLEEIQKQIEKELIKKEDETSKLVSELHDNIVSIMKTTGLGDTVTAKSIKEKISVVNDMIKAKKVDLEALGFDFSKGQKELGKVYNIADINKRVNAVFYGAGLVEDDLLEVYNKIALKAEQYENAIKKLVEGKVSREDIEKIISGKITSGDRKRIIKQLGGKENLLDKLSSLVEDITKLQTDMAGHKMVLDSKSKLFKEGVDIIANARRIVKKKYADAGIPDFGSKALNEAAQALWGNDGIMHRLGKEIGLDEQDLYKLYIPELYKQERHINAMANGSPSWYKSKGVLTKDGLLPLKEFRDAGGITNLKEVLSQHAKNMSDEIVKTQYFNTAIETFGRSTDYFQKEGMSLERAKEIAKESGYVYIDRPQIGTRKTQSGFFPQELADDIKNGFVQKELGALTKTGIFKTYDWYTSLFKSAVTGLFPQFHFTNWAGNNINSMVAMGLSALDPYTQSLAGKMAFANLKDYRTLDGIMSSKIGQGIRDRYTLKYKELEKEIMTRADGTTMKATEFFEAVKKEYPDLFHSGQFGMNEMGLGSSDMPKLLESLLNKADNYGKLGGFSSEMMRQILDPQSRSWQGIRDVGSIIEAQGKLNVIINSWKNGKSIKDAVKESEKILFNYSKLTPFEKEIMRRIIPFYGFMRKNMEFQLQMLRDKPAHVFAQFKALNNATMSFSNAHEQTNEGLPAYLDNTMGFHVGNVGSENHKYVTGNVLPIQQALQFFGGENSILGNAVKNVISNSNPLLKSPVEYATGYDLFRGRKIEEISNPDEFSSMIAGMDNVVGKQFRELIDYREVNKPIVVDGVYLGDKKVVSANPTFLWMLRTMPTSRMTNTVGNLFGENAEISSGRLQMKMLTGINIYDVDDQRNIFMRRMSKFEELGKWMERIGLLNDYTSYTMPMKNARAKEYGLTGLE